MTVAVHANEGDVQLNPDGTKKKNVLHIRLPPIFERTNLNANLLACNYFLGAVAFSDLMIGVILVTSIHWSQAYGTVIYETGGGMIFMALLQMPMAFFGTYGGRKHNKFALLLHAGVMGFSIFLMFLFGGLIMVPTQTPYTDELAANCIQETPADTFDGPGLTKEQTKAECGDYLTGDAQQGFKMVWYSFMHRQVEDDVYKKDILDWQRFNGCCGFGPPQGCIEDLEEMPGHLPVESKSSWMFSGVRQKCGVKPGWYPATPYCNLVIDPNKYPPDYGGCPYDNPLGECSTVFPDRKQKGCALVLEKEYRAKVGNSAWTVLIMSFIPGIAGLCSCCLIFKRKDYDVLPETYPGLIPKKKKVAAELDEDGLLALTVAETTHEFLKALDMIRLDALGKHGTLYWTMEDFTRTAGEKREKCEKTWTQEVQKAYIVALKLVDKLEEEKRNEALAPAQK
jgi:hypothetical protein